MADNKHTKATWISAGLAALKTNPTDPLRAETLAKKLGTTKGSFYWHFADVPQFHIAIIDSWRNEVLVGIVSQLSDNGAAQKRLDAFSQQILADQIDPAMRTWARTNSHAKAALQLVDEQRLTYIGTLLASLGVANPAFALACYSTLIGSSAIQTDTTPRDAFAALLDLIIALK